MTPISPSKPNFQRLSSCNDCSGLISKEAPSCPHCGKIYTVIKKNIAAKIVLTILFIGVVLASVLSGVILVSGLAESNGAPQQAAVAAVCAALVIIPYCLVRSLASIFNLFNE